MKATVFDIQRFSVHDGPGIRTTVFMKGCALRCAWCHNPEGLSPATQIQFFPERCISCGTCGGVKSRESAENCPREAIVACGREIDEDTLLEELLRDKSFYGTDGGVTFSGGECLLQSEFVAQMLSRISSLGISGAVDTAGFVPWENFARTLDFADLYLYDVKCIDPDLHKKFIGKDNALILENLSRLAKTGKRIWIRVPVIPAFNNNTAELSAIADLVSTLGVERLSLMPYHTLGKNKYASLGLTPPYETDERISKESLSEFYKIFSDKGIPIEKK